MAGNAPRASWRYAKVAILTGIAAGLAWLVTRHLSHAWQILPYLLILACPLMHIFHRGHGHGGHSSRSLRPEKFPVE